MKNDKYTVYFNNFHKGFQDELDKYQSRFDYRAILRDYDETLNINVRKRLYNKLCGLCKRDGVNPDKLIDRGTREKELGKLSSEDELIRYIVRTMNGLISKFPDTEDYIDRLVRRRLKNEGIECGEDSCRVMIIKQFARHMDSLSEPVLNYAKSKLNDEKKKEFESKKPEEKREYLIENGINESLFDALDNYENGNEGSEPSPKDMIFFYRRLYSGNQGSVRGRRSGGESAYVEGNEEILERINDDLKKLEAELKDLGISDFVGISMQNLDMVLQQIERYGFLDKKPELVRALDTFFDQYYSIKQDIERKKRPVGEERNKVKIVKEYKKRKKKYVESFASSVLEAEYTDPYLFIVSNDLAKGRFHTKSGRTKSRLYLFAYAFDMRIFVEKKDGYDEWSDIEKNLFYDYYNQNYLKYLKSDFVDSRGKYEEEPSGYGIDFKNFAEVIYLYYLNNREKLDLSRNAAYVKANETIITCVKRYGNNQKNDAGHAENKMTQYFAREFFGDGDVLGILDEEEENLVDVVGVRYTIPDDKNNNDIEKLIGANNKRHTAAIEYGKLIDNIAKSKCSKDEDSFLEYFSDEALTWLGEKFPEDHEFAQIISVDSPVRRILKNMLKERECIEGEDNISRSDIIRAFYVCFWYSEGDFLYDCHVKQLYYEFCGGLDASGDEYGINPILERCGFQSISEKNIFDLFMLLLLYIRWIREQGKEESN